jgi:hypothetical protein
MGSTTTNHFYISGPDPHAVAGAVVDKLNQQNRVRR